MLPIRRDLLGLAFLLACRAQAATPAEPWRAWRWRSRLPLIFAPSPDDPALLHQRADLAADDPGLAERDIVTVEIIAGASSEPRLDGLAVRSALHVPDTDFMAILIGKDGGEKRRVPHPITASFLFAIVDAMPMRRREMQTAPAPSPAPAARSGL